jgi:tRNA(His) 5'-end guanylyltransferase
MSKGKDEFGDRMKMYEMAEAGRMFMPLLPIIVRLDGKNFSRWTKGLKRPYDERMVSLMTEVTKHLVEQTNALIGYTQSDEISLILHSDDIKSQVFFNGRIQKLTSVIASMATADFNDAALSKIYHTLAFAHFDCRAWQVPNKVEAVNAILWREQDATKNSVSMAAREYYSHQELMDQGRADMMDLLMEKGVNWNNYPSAFKRGTYVQRRTRKRKFTTEEMEKLPNQHQARLNPELEVTRSEVVVLDLPPLSKVQNKVGVIFEGEDPIVVTIEPNEQDETRKETL